ncbi:hypothetical protein MJ579_00590 [Klebsiella pneumoniae]|nr:hypothetical protein MJ579_00590 [Klebsiella pneumoniae]
MLRPVPVAATVPAKDVSTAGTPARARAFQRRGGHFPQELYHLLESIRRGCIL